MYFFVSVFFHSVCLWDLSDVSCISTWFFFKLLYSIIWTDHNLSILLLICIWVICSFGLLWVKLLLAFFMSFGGQMYSFLLGKYLGVGLLCPVANVWLTYKKLPNCFPHWTNIHSYQQCTGVLVTPYSGQCLIFIIFHFSHSGGYTVVSHCGFYILCKCFWF